MFHLSRSQKAKPVNDKRVFEAQKFINTPKALAATSGQISLAALSTKQALKDYCEHG